MEACEKADSNPIHKKIVDQIVAVDNFVAFKKLMVKRNAELNKQAIAMLKKQAQNAEESKSNEVNESSADTLKPTIMNRGEKKKNTETILAEQEGNIKNKNLDKEMQEAIKIAQDLERQEEEEFMRRAIEESAKLDEVNKQKDAEIEDEEMKMIQ